MMTRFDCPSLRLSNLHTHSSSLAPDLILNLTASCKLWPLSFPFSQCPEILWISSSCCIPRILTHTGPRVHLLAQLTWWRGLGNFPEQPREKAPVETTLLSPTRSLLQEVFSPQDTFKAHHFGNRAGHEGTQENSVSKLGSGWMGDIQRSLAANVPLSLWNQITLSGAPSERNGYESWVVIKDSFRCRDSE